MGALLMTLDSHDSGVVHNNAFLMQKREALFRE